MDIKLKQLKLLCRKGEEIVPFSPELSFFHGEMSAGKSTIPDLINYCLGGRIVYTTALQKELVSVELEFSIGGTSYLIERNPEVKTLIDVSWQSENEIGRETLPLAAKNDAVIQPDIFCFSDFLIKALGQPVIKVRKKTNDPESELERLSVRDLFQFVYLSQHDLDSSFFLLEQPIRAEKSKDALRFFTGLWNEKLNELEAQLSSLRRDQRAKREAVAQIDIFLQKFGFSSEDELKSQISSARDERENIEEALDKLHQYDSPEFTVSEKSQRARSILSGRISEKQLIIDELEERILEQESLIAEFISMKFKAARTTAASKLLGGADFHSCPACGSDVTPQKPNKDNCYLCKSHIGEASENVGIELEIVDQDLNDRIEDLKRSVSKMKRSLDTHQRSLKEFLVERSEIEDSIKYFRKNSESEYLTKIREYESRLGGLRERIKILSRVQEMPAEIERILSEADKISEQIDEKKRRIGEEENKLSEGDLNIKFLEDNFLSILCSTKFPGISVDDKISINRKTWTVTVHSHGGDSVKYTFDDLGSGGKKVLFKICFALALHVTTAKRNLTVPRLLIVDSSMKNIATDINPGVFKAFYNSLYQLMETELLGWQVVIVDQTYKKPPEDIEVYERKLTRDNPEFPPLISYYRGA